MLNRFLALLGGVFLATVLFSYMSTAAESNVSENNFPADLVICELDENGDRAFYLPGYQYYKTTHVDNILWSGQPELYYVARKFPENNPLGDEINIIGSLPRGFLLNLIPPWEMKTK